MRASASARATGSRRIAAKSKSSADTCSDDRTSFPPPPTRDPQSAETAHLGGECFRDLGALRPDGSFGDEALGSAATAGRPVGHERGSWRAVSTNDAL